MPRTLQMDPVAVKSMEVVYDIPRVMLRLVRPSWPCWLP